MKSRKDGRVEGSEKHADHPRDGWEEKLRDAGTPSADELLLDRVPNDFDHSEWDW